MNSKTTTEKHLVWVYCGGDDDPHWCSLETLKLPLKNKTHGVYLIWYVGERNSMVYVGQGDVSDRLAKHRKDPEILAYAKKGELKTTWASVQESDRDGVEAYLADRYSPLVGDSHPNADPIPVNFPKLPKKKAA